MQFVFLKTDTKIEQKSWTGSWVDLPCTEEHGYVCKKPMTVSAVTSMSPFSVGCPVRALGYGSLCYQFADTSPMTWEDAEGFCSRQHGHLATLNTLQIQFFVAAELVYKKNSTHYWIGLTDHAAPGTYTWSSGLSLDYTAWSSNHTGEFLLSSLLRSTSYQDLFWIGLTDADKESTFLMTLLENATDDVYIGLNDQHVNQQFVWQSNEEVTFTNWASGQPNVSYPKETPVICEGKSDYHHYRDSCYGTYKMAKNWTDAQSTCLLDGGQLLSVRDVHELAEVTTLVPSDVTDAVWTGLSFDSSLGEYSWVDGWPVTFTQWDSGEPNLQSAGSCVTMLDGMWSDTFCNETHPFVCKITSAKPPPTTPAPPGHCANNTWAPFGDFCYYAAPQNTKSWPEANYLCRKMGLELLSVHSVEELTFVQSLVKLATTTTAYSYYSASLNRVWIGLQRTLEGGFRWTDGSAVDFFQWNEGEPNNQHNEEDCAELLVDSGRWNDMPCIGSNRGFVCKTPKIMPSSTTTTTSSSTSSTTTTTVPPTASPQTVAPPTPAKNSFVPTPSIASTHPITPFFNRIITDKSPVKNNDKTTLSEGEIAGIVIGLFGLIVIVGAVIFVFRRRMSRSVPLGFVENATGFDNALYDKHGEEVSITPNGVSNGSNRLTIVNHADDEDC
nr:hypothetical protein BaRGS_026508 [Batillaria attramentaria]